MKLADAPKKHPVPFGVNGLRESLPNTTPAGDNTASYNLGFPPITMTLKSAGGLPPKGQDMNQILYELSSLSRWASAGAFNKYDSTFATAVGGYPKQSIIASDDGSTLFISTIDDNLNNPNAVATGWISFSNIISKANGAMQKAQNGSDIEDKGAFQNNLGLTFSGTTTSFVSHGPGIMIMQGGKVTAPSGTGNFLVVNFPQAFPNGCVSAFAIFEDGVYNQTPFELSIVPTDTNMTVGILSSGGSVFFNERSIRWLAVGF